MSSSDILPIHVAYKLREALKNEYATHGGVVQIKYIPQGLSHQEQTKHYSKYYKRYFGFTSPKSLRPETDRFQGKSLYFRSRYYNELNIEDGELTFFTPAQRKKKITYPIMIPNQGEDIICGL